jgi:AraC-like DNA-binding protein
MAATGQAQHTQTGYQAIDCIAYRNAPVALSLAAAPRDILLYRVIDYGPSRINSADRPAADNDLLLLARGSGRPAHGRIGGQRYNFPPNRELRASFVPSGADSQIEFGTSAKSVNLIFPTGYLDSLVAERGGRASAPLLSTDNKALIGLISLIELEMFRPGLATDLVAEQAMRSIALILSGIDPNGFIAESERISLPPVRLKRVIDFIEANLAEPLTLDLLAHVAGLSVFHFARVFRQATGTSPYRYVSERRVQRAQNLLMTRELSVHEIALACGFVRHANFSAAFARARGMSPSAFRAYFAL